MFRKTVRRFFSDLFFSNIKKINVLHNYFFLLVGFLGGNLCGSIFSKTSLSAFFFIIGIVFCFEIFSYVYYKSLILHLLKKNNLKQVKLINLKNMKLLYFIKIGTLFGLFVDAFKVGS